MVTRWPVGRLPSTKTASSRISLDCDSSSATTGTLPSGSRRLAQSARVSAPVERVAILSSYLVFRLIRIQARRQILPALRTFARACRHELVLTDSFAGLVKRPDQFRMVAKAGFVQQRAQLGGAESVQRFLGHREVFGQPLAAVQMENFQMVQNEWAETAKGDKEFGGDLRADGVEH